MAIAIKSVPVLKENIARRFVEKAEDSLKQKGTIDFSKEAAIAKRILEKAKMK